MKALLVDDEFNVRDVIRYLGQWEKNGITDILEAGNGQEAKVVIERECPEILFVDVKMPKMNGIELLEWLHSEQYPGKVILITGFDDYGYMRKAIQYGSYDYLLKPVESDALNEALAGAVLAWKKEEQERREKGAGYYDEVKKLRLNRAITAAYSEEPYDAGEIAGCLPKADLYDLTLIYFYEAHHPAPYIRRLSDMLAAREWGYAFVPQTDRKLCAVISVHGKLLAIEEWITQLFDIPVRLVSGDLVRQLEELHASFNAAKQAWSEQNFRTIHRLSELDDARRMQDIVAYINEHYMEELSLDKLSAQFFLSREHISRRFKQEKGVTLSHYAIQLRIEQAKRWLSETDEKMYSISVKLGYQDEKYFSKLFKKIVGMTPLEYRTFAQQQK